MFKKILILSLIFAALTPAAVFAGTKVVADFNSASTPFNIDAASSMGTDPGNYYWTFVSTVAHGNTGYSLQFNRIGGVTSYLIMNFGTAKDFSQYKAFSFWIKGAAGGECFRLSLESAAAGANPNLRPNVRDFLPIGVTTEWQKVVIPISSMFQNVKSTCIASVNQLVFTIDDPTAPDEVVYIDDIELHSNCAPVVVNTFEAPYGYNSFGRSYTPAGDVGATAAYVTTTSYQGSRSIALNYQVNGGWGAVFEERFCEDSPDDSLPLDLSACDTIEVALQRGYTSGASINPQVELWSQGSPVGHSSTLAIDNTMTLYTVSLASLDNSYTVSGSSYTRLFKVYFSGASPSNSTCFIDEIRFVNNSTPTIPTAFLANGQAVGDSFAFSSACVLQATADEYNSTTHKLMEHVRFEHDNLSGGQSWYTIGRDTDTANTTYTWPWVTTGLLESATYQVRAVAENINGNTAALKYINCSIGQPPADITDLAAVAGSTDGTVRLSWTAPGDNGVSGNLDNGAYLIKVSTFYINTANFDAVSDNMPASFSVQFSTNNVAPYSYQMSMITGLYPGTTYFFAIKAMDDTSTWSVWQGTGTDVNPNSFKAAQDLAPNAVESVTAIQGSTKIDLSWVRPSSPVYFNDYSKFWVYMSTSPFAENERNNEYVSVAATIAYVALQDPVTAQIIGLDNYTTYFFHLGTFDLDSQGGLFSIAHESFSLVEASTMTVLMAPDAASGFNGVALSTYSIQWSWVDSPNDEGYKVKYASSPADSASPDQGTDVVTWTESDGLTANVAYGRTVAAFNGAGESDLANSATVYTLADTPLNLVVGNVSKSSATLVWDDDTNPNTTVYGVSYSSVGYYVNVTTAVNYVKGLTAHTTAIYDLNDGATYYFRAWAYNGNLIETASIEISTITLQTLTPSGFSGVAYSSYTMCWSWTPVNNAWGYRVKYASSPVVDASPSLASSATYWIENDGLSGNTAYGRGVVAYAGIYESSLSNTATAYTLTNPPGNPEVSDVGLSTITVSWDMNGNPSARFGLSYTTDQDYLVGVTTPINYATDFTALTTTYYGLSASTTYFFHIWTYNGGQVASAFVQTSTKTLDGPPDQPAGFDGTALSSSSIQWTWTDVSGETGYRVNFASSPSQSLTASGNLAANTVSWPEGSLSPNRPYGRCVVAYNVSGEGSLSDSATVYTLAEPPPAASLVVSNVITSSITLTWSAGDNPANTRFGVSYSTTGLYDVSVTTVVKFSNNLTANTTNMLYLTDGTSYYFRVWAYNENQFQSAAVTVSTRTIQTNTPTGFIGTVPTTTSIQWSWNPVTCDSYRVKCATEPTTTIRTQIDSVWIEEGLLVNRPYGRGVVSVTSGFESSLSNTTTVYTKANAPVTPSTSSVLTTSIVVAWNDNSNPSWTRYGVSYSSVGYYVNVSTPVNYTSVNTALSATISSLTKGTTYYMRVWAYNGAQIITASVQLSTVCTLAYMDTTAPEISGVTEVTATYFLKKNINIAASVTDDEEIASAALNYKVNSGGWKSVAMTEAAGGTDISKQYTSAIPGSEITAVGNVYYYISAVDATDNVGLWKSSAAPQAVEVKQVLSLSVSSGTVNLPDSNDDDGTVSVTIPEGALRTSTVITIESLDPDEITTPPSVSDSARPASAYEFGPSSTTFRKPVTLTLLFTDLNPKDGVEDNLNVPVKNLRVFHWDGFEWRLLGGIVNDYNASDSSKVNTVSVQTMHFSRFALYPLKTGSASYKPKEKIITPATKDGINDLAQFDGLSGEDVKIKIYDIEGRLMRTVNVLKEGNVWNGISDDGQIVESGVYIYQFKFQDKLYSGTIIVAK
ncbi:MAG: gliding motility-associated C-terminal domain-containing protein [Elusimicrobiota bacterium]